MYDYVYIYIGKLSSYIQKGRKLNFLESICDGVFATFAVTFFITRLIIFPYYCVYDTYYTYGNRFGTSHGLYWIWMVLLCALQALHIFWFSIIGKMVYMMFATDKVVEDIRSDDEMEVNDQGQEISTRESNRRVHVPPPGVEAKIAHKKTK